MTRYSLKQLNITLCLTAVFGLHLIGLAGYLMHLRSGFMLDPVLARPYGLFSVYWYGVVLLVSIGIGFWAVATQSAKSDVLPSFSVWRYAISIVLSGIVGARLFDVVFLSPIAISQGITGTWDYFDNPALLFDFNWGGLNIWGALFGSVLMLYWVCWRAAIPRILIFFKATSGFLIGLSLVQWGHFLNQELYGVPWNRLGSILIESIHRLPLYAGADRFVPLFLLAAVWYLAGGMWLFFGRRWQRTLVDQLDGILFGLIWFAVGRLFLELVTPNSLFNWLPASMLLAIIFITVFIRKNI
ncbi:MAG: prolipoprotein diacylglyceryltransferase [Cellvibrionaceae bacterium]|jgi:prolipoprotein diacylglyceryltransferase